MVIALGLYFYYSQTSEPKEELESALIEKNFEQELHQLVSPNLNNEILVSDQLNISDLDILIANDITNALTIEDYLTRVSELVRLADINTNNELLQYLASVSCVRLKENPCDPKRFAQRLLAINPNNAIGKELLVTDSLLQNDFESALTILENIQQTDDYSSYFSEVAENVKRSLLDKPDFYENLIQDIMNSPKFTDEPMVKNLSKERLKDLKVNSHAIGVAAAQSINPKVSQACYAQVKSNSQKQRWLNACHDYGVSMQNSVQMIDHFMGAKLQLTMLELKGDAEAAWLVQKTIEEHRHIFEKSADISINGRFLLSEEFELYASELIEFGDIEAMKRLIERHTN